MPDHPQTFPYADYFDALKAEYEHEWLSATYVRPVEYDAMSGMRSVIIFGEEGSGKSALQHILLQDAKAMNILPAFWYPEPDHRNQTAEAVMQSFRLQIFDSIAYALLEYMGRNAQRCLGAPVWAQKTLRWFIQTYSQGDFEYRLSRLEEQLETAQIQFLERFLQGTSQCDLQPDSPTTKVIKELTASVKRIQVAGIWIFVEGVDSWSRVDLVGLTGVMSDLFSTLALFEVPGFAVKVIAPQSLKKELTPSGGVARRRFEIFDLTWRTKTLRSMVDLRLQAAAGKENLTLDGLCDNAQWAEWVEKNGGLNPRGWLSLVGPAFSEYMQTGKPMNTEQWERYRQRFAPRLQVDEMQKKTFIGYCQIDLPPSGQTILEYLYRHRERACTKSELYYRAHLGYDHEPGRGEPKWEAPKIWEGVIDTALWRLRQALEWDTGNPIYLVSERGKGLVRLENTR